jgi:hypothetical protein
MARATRAVCHWLLLIQLALVTPPAAPTATALASCDCADSSLVCRSLNSCTGGIPDDVGLRLPAVTEIYLAGSGLTGTLPASFGSFTALKIIQIAGAPHVFGTMPASIGSLSALVSLAITSVPLEGFLPSSLGSLNALTALKLVAAGFSGRIPSSMGRLERLNSLWVERLALSSALPESMAALTDLQDLRYQHLNNVRAVRPARLPLPLLRWRRRC